MTSKPQKHVLGYSCWIDTDADATRVVIRDRAGAVAYEGSAVDCPVQPDHGEPWSSSLDNAKMNMSAEEAEALGDAERFEEVILVHAPISYEEMIRRFPALADK